MTRRYEVWIWRLFVTVWCGVTGGIVYGAARYHWPQLDDALQRLFWASMTLWF